MSSKHADTSTGPHDYLERSMPTRTIFLWVIGLLIGLACVEAFVYHFYGTPKQHPVPDLVLGRPMNQPTLQADPKQNMKAFLARQNEELSTYGWVNKEQKVVRLPIEKAMEMVLQKGLPARGTKQP